MRLDGCHQNASSSVGCVATLWRDPSKQDFVVVCSGIAIVRVSNARSFPIALWFC